MGYGEKSTRTALEGSLVAPVKIQGGHTIDLGIPLLGSTLEKHLPVTQSVINDIHFHTGAHFSLKGTSFVLGSW